MEVEQIALTHIAISNEKWDHRDIHFTEAKVMLVTQYGDRLWYVDVDGVSDGELLDWFSSSENIAVSMVARSSDGEVLEGAGFLHPNTLHRAAAIRGAGELKRKEA